MGDGGAERTNFWSLKRGGALAVTVTAALLGLISRWCLEAGKIPCDQVPSGTIVAVFLLGAAVAGVLGCWRGRESFAEDYGDAFKEVALYAILWTLAFFLGTLGEWSARVTLVYIIPPTVLFCGWYATYDPRRYHNR